MIPAVKNKFPVKNGFLFFGGIGNFWLIQTTAGHSHSQMHSVHSQHANTLAIYSSLVTVFSLKQPKVSYIMIIISQSKQQVHWHSFLYTDIISLLLFIKWVSILSLPLWCAGITATMTFSCTHINTGVAVNWYFAYYNILLSSFILTT